MKKTIDIVARALPCIIFKGNIQTELKLNNDSREVADRIHPQSLDGKGIRRLALLAGYEINLEWLRRKRLLLLIISIFFLMHSVQAQHINDVPKLDVGDKIPNILLVNLLNHPKTKIYYSELRGKAVILDFWATHCAPCLKRFPKIDSLQKHYGKNVQFLLINTYVKDTMPVLSDFLNKEKLKIPDFSLPIIPTDSNLRTIFPVKIIPHYIWIGADGRIKAITSANEVTKSNIDRLIAGLTLNLKLKRD